MLVLTSDDSSDYTVKSPGTVLKSFNFFKKQLLSRAFVNVTNQQWLEPFQKDVSFPYRTSNCKGLVWLERNDESWVLFFFSEE